MQSYKFFTNVLLLSLMLTAGCMQVSDQDSDSGQSDQSTQSVQTHIITGTLSEQNPIDDTQNPYTIAAATQPSFTVDLNMPTSFTTLQKLDHNQTLLWQKDPKEHFLDSDLLPGEVYTYQLGNIVNGNFVVTDSWTVDVPYDLVVSGSQALYSIPDFKLAKVRNLVFANSDATLAISTANITLHAHKIISGDGVITAFVGAATVAAWETTGANAGTLTLSADNFVGRLHINLTGQRGGNWYDMGQGAPRGGAPGVLNLNLPPSSDVEIVRNQGLLGNLLPSL